MTGDSDTSGADGSRIWDDAFEHGCNTGMNGSLHAGPAGMHCDGMDTDDTDSDNGGGADCGNADTYEDSTHTGLSDADYTPDTVVDAANLDAKYPGFVGDGGNSSGSNRSNSDTSSLTARLELQANRRKRKKTLADGFKKNKVVNEVLDKPTIMTLYKMISDGTLSGVNGSVSAGKESLVFWGLDGDGGSVALKVYLVSTSNFKRRQAYVVGDPRFASVKKNTRSLVYLWAKKEFRNLTQCAAAGVPVPKPIRVENNVLAMEFVECPNTARADHTSGNESLPGRPATLLLHSDVTYDDYLQALSIMSDMYKKANLVHGDYSEYNLFKVKGRGLVVFDLGSAVDKRHPNSDALLQRDINNITRFFKRRGVDVDTDTNKIMEHVML